MAIAIGLGVRLSNQKMRISAFHSEKQTVHHVCTRCSAGRGIAADDVREGTGGKPLCKECQNLIQQDRC